MMRGFMLGTLAFLMLIAGCDDTKEAGQDTVRQLSGSSMIQQKKVMKQKLQQLDQQQQEQYKQLDQQLNQ